MGKKGKLFLTVIPINKDGTKETELHHLANTTVIAVSGKNYQWVLKLGGKKMRGKRIFTLCQVLSHKTLISYKGTNSNFAVGTIADTTSNGDQREHHQ